MDSSNSLNDGRKQAGPGGIAGLVTPIGPTVGLEPATQRPPYQSVLDEAHKAVNGERQENYGSQSQNFQNIADIWRVILGVSVTPQQVAMCMAGLKLARLIKTNGHHRDSIVDIAGYAECLAKINEGY